MTAQTPTPAAREPGTGTPDGRSFPRHSARTLRFTLGVPRNFVVSPDGSRVAFLRAPSGTDRRTVLWVADVADTVTERVVADPRELAGDDEALSASERARRERAREGAAGIVSYATDREVRRAVFTLSGTLYVAELTGPPDVRQLAAHGPVFDPRPDPTGCQIAYVAGDSVRLIDVATGRDRAVPGQDTAPNVSWGLAEFIAAEEMGRSRGYWWAPDGTALLVARVDTTDVQRWHIADPANPGRVPLEIAYPAAGTPNAAVSLHLLDLAGGLVDVTWDRAAHEYLAAVHWSSRGAPLLHVQDRRQCNTQVLAVDVSTGACTVLHDDADPEWVELVDGAPCWGPSGELVHVADSAGHRRLFVGARMASAELQVRAVLGSVSAKGDTQVLFTASAEDPAQIHVYRAGAASLVQLSEGPGVHDAAAAGPVQLSEGPGVHDAAAAGPVQLSEGPGVHDAAAAGPVQLSEGPGVHGAAAGGSTLVLVSARPDRLGRRIGVSRDGRSVGEIAALPDDPGFVPWVQRLSAGPRGLCTAVLLPRDHVPGMALPVLLDPYGGPHAQRVLASANSFLEPQWWADQGFAVVVADGRGTPGRDSAWERAVAGDLAAPVLQDQIDALHAVAERFGDLDLNRVAIRGWSFGGYLAALAALRRPDVFHAAIAGAPVTDWALYDTHYTERYLGTPDDDPENYARSSLCTDGVLSPDLVPRPGDPVRPLLLVHGLADDNVVAAHTLQLSAALLAVGRPHQVLPLSGVTHMTPQETVSENLLLMQLDFLRRSLGG
jgi:dipeptidyl-peptidase-4